MNYWFHIVIMINIYVILTVSTNLMVGLSNLLTLGQAAFYGLGAYLGAWAVMSLQLPLIPGLLLVMSGAAIFGFILGFATSRLEGDYFVLVTLGFQMIVYTVLYNWIEITKGPFGIPGIPAPKLFGHIEISTIQDFLILSSILVVIICFIFYRLINSPFGRNLKAMRDDKLSLLALGRNVSYLKIKSIVIASAFTAISGYLFATYISYIDPTSFNTDEAIFILSAVVIGGTGNIKGPVIGAIFVIILPEILRFVGLPGNIAANLRVIIYGLSIVVLMRIRPQGLLGNFKFSKD